MADSPAWLDRAQWPWTARWCQVPDGRLHYVDEGTGPTVVLVHGTPTWGYEWRHVVAALSPRMRVVVPDHLGFGLSERPAAADYRPEAHAARFGAFMDAVPGPEPVSLVVHDFGGPIALAWALAHPERVRTLTVVNSWMWSFERDRVMRRRAAMASGWLGRQLYRHANASLRLIMPSAYADRRRLTRDIHRQYLEVFPDADSRERVLFTLAKALLGSSAFYAGLWAQRTRLTGSSADGTVSANLEGRAGSPPRLRSGQASPALSVIWGMRDSAFGPAILQQWVEAFPHAVVTRIDDAGHWPHEEQPEAFIAALNRSQEVRSQESGTAP